LGCPGNPGRLSSWSNAPECTLASASISARNVAREIGARAAFPRRRVIDDEPPERHLPTKPDPETTPPKPPPQHVRRKFFELESSFTTEAKQVLDLIDELFAIEALCVTGPPGNEMRAQLRADRSRPLIKQIEQWALSVHEAGVS